MNDIGNNVVHFFIFMWHSMECLYIKYSLFLFCGFSLKVSVSAVQTLRGQARPALLGPTVPLPYMYTCSGYVNFDMWVSISPIFTMGFIRP